jgi:hypothetical protein
MLQDAAANRAISTDQHCVPLAPHVFAAALFSSFSGHFAADMCCVCMLQVHHRLFVCSNAREQKSNTVANTTVINITPGSERLSATGLKVGHRHCRSTQDQSQTYM